MIEMSVHLLLSILCIISLIVITTIVLGGIGFLIKWCYDKYKNGSREDVNSVDYDADIEDEGDEVEHLKKDDDDAGTSGDEGGNPDAFDEGAIRCCGHRHSRPKWITTTEH